MFSIEMVWWCHCIMSSVWAECLYGEGSKNTVCLKFLTFFYSKWQSHNPPSNTNTHTPHTLNTLISHSRLFLKQFWKCLWGVSLVALFWLPPCPELIQYLLPLVILTLRKPEVSRCQINGKDRWGHTIVVLWACFSIGWHLIFDHTSWEHSWKRTPELLQKVSRTVG